MKNFMNLFRQGCRGGMNTKFTPPSTTAKGFRNEFWSTLRPECSGKPAFNCKNIEFIGEVAGGDYIPQLPTQGFPGVFMNDGQDFSGFPLAAERNWKSTARTSPGAPPFVMVGRSDTSARFCGVSRPPGGLHSPMNTEFCCHRAPSCPPLLAQTPVANPAARFCPHTGAAERRGSTQSQRHCRT